MKKFYIIILVTITLAIGAIVFIPEAHAQSIDTQQYVDVYASTNPDTKVSQSPEGQSYPFNVWRYLVPDMITNYWYYPYTENTPSNPHLYYSKDDYSPQNTKFWIYTNWTDVQPSNLTYQTFSYGAGQNSFYREGVESKQFIAKPYILEAQFERPMYVATYNRALGKYVQASFAPTQSQGWTRWTAVRINFYMMPLQSSSYTDPLTFGLSIQLKQEGQSEYVDWTNIADDVTYLTHDFGIAVYDVLMAQEISSRNSEGYSSGYNDGKTVGRQEGFQQGQEIGKEQGIQQGIQQGISQGYNQGYDVGYNTGYADGVETDFNFFNIVLDGIFGTVTRVGNIELFPNFTIGMVVGIVIAFGLIYFIIGKRRGGD